MTRRDVAAAVTAVALCTACGSRERITVAVTFANSWRVGAEPLTAAEQAALKQAALDAIRLAFSGFDVRVSEEPSREARAIRVEDTPYGSMQLFGATGVTYPTARTSSVRMDVLANAELAAVHCHDVAHCPAAPRAALVEGLGRGIGATAAHELGHQAGFHFALDSGCDDCYDGGTSTSYAHFFGTKRWSDRALQIMKRTIRPEGR
jgi:hypothetical protein